MLSVSQSVKLTHVDCFPINKHSLRIHPLSVLQADL